MIVRGLFRGDRFACGLCQGPRDREEQCKKQRNYSRAMCPPRTVLLAAGRASTFLLAAGVVIVWAISGPLFHFSDTWQLVINTGTTIVTFLMVFLIQKIGITRLFK